MKVVKNESSIAKEMTLEQAKVLREFMKAQDEADGRGGMFTYRIKARGPRKIHGVRRDLPLHLGKSFSLYRHDNDSYWSRLREIYMAHFEVLNFEKPTYGMWYKFKLLYQKGDIPRITKNFYETAMKGAVKK